MKILDIKDMKGGWFVGNFSPTAFKTEDFEVCYKVHKKDEVWDYHYHKKSYEINLLVKGEMRLQDTTLKAGDIFIMSPYEIADPEFLQDCELVVVKTPSSKNDKFAFKLIDK